MKKVLLTIVLAVAPAAAAHAQFKLDYSKKTKHGTLRFSIGGVHHSGYGFGYGSFGPGVVGKVGGGTLQFGVRHSFGSFYGPSGYGVSGGTYRVAGTGHGSYYSGPAFGHAYYGGMYRPYRGGLFRPNNSLNEPSRPIPRGSIGASPGAAGPGGEFAVVKEVEEGKKYLKIGHYGGALKKFRAAVIAHTENPTAQLYFAIGLALTGDLPNADKALRAAVKSAPLPKVDLPKLLKGEKERKALLKMLSRKKNQGELSKAYMECLLGEPLALIILAKTDAVAKSLLPKK